jgi:hypothetical protein
MKLLKLMTFMSISVGTHIKRAAYQIHNDYLSGKKLSALNKKTAYSIINPVFLSSLAMTIKSTLNVSIWSARKRNAMTSRLSFILDLIGFSYVSQQQKLFNKQQ